MEYIIHEYQTNAAGDTDIVTPEQRNDYYEALSIFLYKKSVAANSTVEIHSGELVAKNGDQLDKFCFTMEEKRRARGET